MLQVFIIILYQNVFQNPELFGTQVSLSPEQSTLVLVRTAPTAFQNIDIISLLTQQSVMLACWVHF
jgi:hypothetical protein